MDVSAVKDPFKGQLNDSYRPLQERRKWEMSDSLARLLTRGGHCSCVPHPYFKHFIIINAHFNPLPL